MNYSHYQEQVIFRYGVDYVGWPIGAPPFMNPSNMSSAAVPLEILRDALKAGTCRFVKLTPEELKEKKAVFRQRIEAGDVQPLRRKQRKDAGKQRKKNSALEAVDISDEEEELQAPARKKRVVSKVLISDSADEREEDTSNTCSPHTLSTESAAVSSVPLAPVVELPTASSPPRTPSGTVVPPQDLSSPQDPLPVPACPSRPHPRPHFRASTPSITSTVSSIAPDSDLLIGSTRNTLTASTAPDNDDILTSSTRANKPPVPLSSASTLGKRHRAAPSRYPQTVAKETQQTQTDENKENE
jgi:hypothetical protein